MSDEALLEEFLTSRSEEAFRTLVQRHCELVYSVAFRQLHDRELARDVSQQVFGKLAARAGVVPDKVSIVSWLCRSARSLAIDVIRREESRKRRESQFGQLSPPVPADAAVPEWGQAEALLDTLVCELPEIERRAVLLRFYEGRSHGSVGAELGISEEAARKRITQAVRKLRDLLARSGVLISSASGMENLLGQQASAGMPAPVKSALFRSLKGKPALSVPTPLRRPFRWGKLQGVSAALVLIGVGLLVAARQQSPDPPSETRGSSTSKPSARSTAVSTFPLPRRSGPPRELTGESRLISLYGRERVELAKGVREDMKAYLNSLFNKIMTDQSNREAWAAADDYSAFLGDGNLGLVLSLEQGRELAPAAATVARAWSNKVRNRLQFLLAHAELSLEVLLARDAFQRGIVTREFCEEMQAQAALPEEDNLVLPLAARGDENDLFDNPEFVALGLKILDPAEAETFRAFLDQRPSNPFPKELPMLLEELKDEWSRLGTLALRGDAGEEPEVPEAGPHEK